MRGSEEGKGDGSSSQRSGGGNGEGGGPVSGSISETGALFPRLHVKETKRVGPRAPPRNKMALYEQFTFPSHRFVPPSLPIPAPGRAAVAPTTMTNYGHQTSYEGSMVYGRPPTFGAMPWMPYMAMNKGSHPGGQPSPNGSTSSSTVVHCEGEWRRGPAVHATDDTARPSSNVAGQGSPWASSHSNVSSISSKKARNSDDCTVPMNSPLKASNHGPSSKTLASDLSAWQAWQPGSGDTAKYCQPASGSSDYQAESSGTMAGRTSRGAYTCSGGVGYGATNGKLGEQVHCEEEQSELEESTVVQKEKQMHNSNAEHSDAQGHDTEHHIHQQHRHKKGVHREDISKGDGSTSCARGEGLNISEERGACGLQQRMTGVKVGRGFTCTQVNESPVANSEERGSDKKEKRGDSRTGGQKMKMHINIFDCLSNSSSETDNDMNANGAEVPEHSQSAVWSESEDESDASSRGPESPRKLSKIKPGNIISAIGKIEFWRTRKLLQRQQKIFSAQVFELHRLIKVQQLLASASNLSLGQGNLVSPAEKEKPEENPEPSQADPVRNADEEAENTEALVGDHEEPKGAMVNLPDSSSHSSSDEVGVQPPTVNPLPDLCKDTEVSSMPNVAPGVSTATWGYPPIPKTGPSSWFGAIPAPNGAYMYQRYPGPLGTPPAHAIGSYNGPYPPVMCVPDPMDVPSMTPYGIPRYEQRPDWMQEMYRYNPYQQQQWPAAMLCPPVSVNPAASWYGVPPPMPYMDPTLRGPYGWYGEMAAGSQLSGPSNYLRPAHQNNAQSMPGAHPAALVMHSPWTGASAGQQAGSHQVSWPSPAETGQIPATGFERPAPFSSGQDSGRPVSQHANGGVSYGTSQTSAPSFQRILPYSSGQDCEVSGSQQVENGGNSGWGHSEGNGSHDHDCGPGVPAGVQFFPANRPEDKSQKRSRESSKRDGKGLGETGEMRHIAEDSERANSPKDALPLFPLVPAVDSRENGKLSSRSSRSVIKVVPRAMVATAESAAEILLSIQKQQQQ